MDEKRNKKNLIAWKYCTKCGKVIELDYYPFNRTIPEELAILEEEHSLHLCTSCVKSFATCNAKKIVFGSCIGNDNVLECDSYNRRKEFPKATGNWGTVTHIGTPFGIFPITSTKDVEEEDEHDKL